MVTLRAVAPLLITLGVALHVDASLRSPFAQNWAEIESLAENICGRTHQGIYLFRTIIDEMIHRVDSNDVTNAFSEPDGTLRLNEVTLLGAHNAYAHPPTYSIFYQHEQDITTQFTFGIRGFMLDTHACDGEVKLAHRECTGPLAFAMTGSFTPRLASLTNTLHTLNHLLDDHSDSIIVIAFEDYAGQSALQSAIEAVPDFANKLLTPGDWDLYDNAGEWPQLSWMRANNKRIILFTPYSTQFAWNLWHDVKENTWQHTFADQGEYFNHRPESNIAQDRTLYFFNYTNMITADFDTSCKYYSTPQADNILHKAEEHGIQDAPNIIFVDRSEAIMNMKIQGRTDTLIDVINQRNTHTASKVYANHNITCCHHIYNNNTRYA